MFCALPSNSDIARRSRHVSKVPIPERTPDREGIMRKRVHMSVQILKSFTFVPQPKFNGDPLLIKRERCLITDAPISVHVTLATTAPIAMLVSLTRCRPPGFQAPTIAIA